MSPWQVKLAFLITLCLWLIIAILAIVCHDRVATAMVLGSAALLTVLRMADQRAVALG